LTRALELTHAQGRRAHPLGEDELEQSERDPPLSQIDHALDKTYSKVGNRYPRDNGWLRQQRFRLPAA